MYVQCTFVYRLQNGRARCSDRENEGAHPGRRLWDTTPPSHTIAAQAPGGICQQGITMHDVSKLDP
jgi:hypothetical protein